MASNTEFLIRIRSDISNFSSGMSAAGRQAESVGRQMSNSFKNIGGGVANSLKSATSGIRSFGSGMVSSIGGFAKSAGSALTSAFKNATSKAAQMISDLGSKALQTAKVAGAALGALGVATAIGGTKYNAAMEQSLISWETLLRDQDKAATMMKDLQKMGKDTPFEFEGLDAAAKKLQMAGFEGEDLFKTLTAVGDTVSAIGGDDETMGGITTALFQISSKGKLQAEEAMQLAERGIPVWGILGKQMGKTEAELMDMARKGQLVAKDVLPVLANGLNEEFGGAMEKQSKTFNGLMSNIRDGIKMLSAKLTVPLFEYLKTVLPVVVAMVDKFTTYIEGNPQKVEAFWGVVLGLFQTVAKVLGNVLGNLYEGVLKPLMAFFQSNKSNVTDFFNTFLEAGRMVWTGIGQVLSQLLESIIKPLLSYLVNNKHIFTDFFGAILGGAKAVIPIVGSLFDTLINGIFKPLFGYLMDNKWIFSEFFGLLGDVAKQVVPIIGGVLKTLIGDVIMPLVETLTSNRGVFSGFFGAFLSVIQGILPVVSSLIDNLLQNVIMPLVNALSENGGKVGEFFAGFGGIASQAVDTLGTLLRGIIDSVLLPLFDLLSSNKDTIFNSLGVAFNTIIEIIPVLQGIIGSLVGGLQELFSTFRGNSDAVPDVFGLIGDTIKSIGPVIQTIITDLVGIIQALFFIFNDGAGEGIAKAFIFIKDTIVGAVTIIMNIVKFLLALLTGDTEMAAEQLKSVVDVLFNWVKSIFVNLVPFLLGVLGNLLKGVTIILATLIEVLTDVIKKVPGLLLQGLTAVGKFIVQGIWNGVKAMASWLYEKVAGFAGGILGSFSKALNIKSPSRKFMEQSKFIVEGVAEGINKFTKTGTEAITGFANNLTDSFNPQLAIDGNNLDIGKSLGNLTAQQMGTATTMMNQKQQIVLEGDLAQLVTRVKTDVASEVQNTTSGGLV